MALTSRHSSAQAEQDLSARSWQDLHRENMELKIQLHTAGRTGGNPQSIAIGDTTCDLRAQLAAKDTLLVRAKEALLKMQAQHTAARRAASEAQEVANSHAQREAEAQAVAANLRATISDLRSRVLQLQASSAYSLADAHAASTLALTAPGAQADAQQWATAANAPARIAEAEIAAATAQQEMYELRAEVLAVKQQLQQAQQQVQAQARRADTAETAGTTTAETVAELQQELSRTKQETRAARDKARSAEQAAGKLEAELSAQRAAIRALLEGGDTSQDRDAPLLDQLVAAWRTLKSSSAAAAHQSMHSLREEQSRTLVAQSQAEELQAELDDVQARYKDACAALQAMQAEDAAAKAEQGSLESQVRELAALLQAREQALDQLEAQLSSERDTASAQIAAAEDERVRHLQEELRAAHAAHAERVDDLRTMVRQWHALVRGKLSDFLQPWKPGASREQHEPAPESDEELLTALSAAPSVRQWFEQSTNSLASQVNARMSGMHRALDAVEDRLSAIAAQVAPALTAAAIAKRERADAAAQRDAALQRASVAEAAASSAQAAKQQAASAMQEARAAAIETEERAARAQAGLTAAHANLAKYREAVAALTAAVEASAGHREAVSASLAALAQQVAALPERNPRAMASHVATTLVGAIDAVRAQAMAPPPAANADNAPPTLDAAQVQAMDTAMSAANGDIARLVKEASALAEATALASAAIAADQDMNAAEQQLAMLQDSNAALCKRLSAAVHEHQTRMEDVVASLPTAKPAQPAPAGDFAATHMPNLGQSAPAGSMAQAAGVLSPLAMPGASQPLPGTAMSGFFPAATAGTAASAPHAAVHHQSRPSASGPWDTGLGSPGARPPKSARTRDSRTSRASVGPGDSGRFHAGGSVRSGSSGRSSKRKAALSASMSDRYRNISDSLRATAQRIAASGT